MARDQPSRPYSQPQEVEIDSTLDRKQVEAFVGQMTQRMEELTARLSEYVQEGAPSLLPLPRLSQRVLSAGSPTGFLCWGRERRAGGDVGVAEGKCPFAESRTKIMIQAPRGTKAVWASAVATFLSKGEVLIARGTTYQVVSMVGNMLTVRVVGQV